MLYYENIKSINNQAYQILNNVKDIELSYL